MLRFRCEGIPRPQGSKNAVASGRVTEASKYLKAWRQSIATEARQASLGMPRVDHRFTSTVQGKKLDLTKRVLYTEAVCVWAWFSMPRAQSWEPGKQHTSPPDLDKLQRAVGDALTVANVIGDDSMIVAWPALPGKYYAGRDEKPGVEVIVAPIRRIPGTNLLVSREAIAIAMTECLPGCAKFNGLGHADGCVHRGPFDTDGGCYEG